VASSLVVQNGLYGSNNEGSQIRQNATAKMNVETTSGSNPPNRRGEVDFTPQTNNFIPSSNLSQFLLKKGSNGSLHTFENEYSYKINLDNLNSNAKPSQASGQSSLGQSIGKKNIGKKNHLFKEVIVEDEAEDLRGSQMGTDLSPIQYHGQYMNQNTASMISKKASGYDNTLTANRESNSPTPQRYVKFKLR
jgi:hypothetical protein